MDSTGSLSVSEPPSGDSRLVAEVRRRVLDPIVAQTREHPLRSLGIALGAGILLAAGARKPLARMALVAIGTRLLRG